MTDQPRAAKLTIEADLRMDLDGRTASLVGDGRRLTFTSDAPQDLWASLRNAGLPLGGSGVRSVGRVADGLASQDLEFHVVGPAGEIAHLGAGAHSWWGRAVTGSSSIEVGSYRGVRSLTAGMFRQSRVFRPAIVAAASAAFVAGVAVTVRRRVSWGLRDQAQR